MDINLKKIDFEDNQAIYPIYLFNSVINKVSVLFKKRIRCPKGLDPLQNSLILPLYDPPHLLQALSLMNNGKIVFNSLPLEMYTYDTHVLAVVTILWQLKLHW